mgnify:CR=1 FL=1
MNVDIIDSNSIDWRDLMRVAKELQARGMQELSGRIFNALKLFPEFEFETMERK